MNSNKKHKIVVGRNVDDGIKDSEKYLNDIVFPKNFSKAKLHFTSQDVLHIASDNQIQLMKFFGLIPSEEEFDIREYHYNAPGLTDQEIHEE